ncbi:MAG: VacJ family lipoprotein [Gammaproteobacteria bacterium]|nr:VacJ family lipoprotein [Gammaproteobacteria bacterium]
MPALRLYLLLVLLFTSASAVAQSDEAFAFASDSGAIAVVEPAENPDPWEPMNRKVFAFNEALDAYFLRPVAKGYRFVTPDPVELGVTNFISNIYEFNTILNSILQGRPGNAFDSLGRLTINSTVGLLGFFDVASAIGVPHVPADFGQTLHTWGADAGPFLMVPVAGPRTLRSGAGLVVDSFTALPSLSGENLFNWTFLGIEAVDVRAQLLKADELISGDRYIFLRNAYLQRRETFLNGGVVIDDFSDFEEGEEFEDF